MSTLPADGDKVAKPVENYDMDFGYHLMQEMGGPELARQFVDSAFEAKDPRPQQQLQQAPEQPQAGQ